MARHGYGSPFILLIAAIVAFLQLAEAERIAEEHLTEGTGGFQRIIGGQHTSIENFNWQVYIYIVQKKEGDVSCGGSIISNTWILTAAHCFTKDRKKKKENPDIKRYLVTAVSVTIYPGLTNLMDIDTNPRYDFDEKYIEKNLFIHENYNRKIENGFKISPRNNDIALIWLNEPIPFGDERNSIPLSMDTTIKEGESLIVSGWGHISSRGEDELINDYKYEEGKCDKIDGIDTIIGKKAYPEALGICLKHVECNAVECKYVGRKTHCNILHCQSEIPEPSTLMHNYIGYALFGSDQNLFKSFPGKTWNDHEVCKYLSFINTDNPEDCKKQCIAIREKMQCNAFEYITDSNRCNLYICIESVLQPTVYDEDFFVSTFHTGFLPHNLYFVSGLEPMSHDDCKKSLDEEFTETMICTKPDKKGPCTGDSGGALVKSRIGNNGQLLNPEQIGIVIFGDGECKGETPEAYLNVVAYQKWIDDTTKKIGEDDDFSFDFCSSHMARYCTNSFVNELCSNTCNKYGVDIVSGRKWCPTLADSGGCTDSLIRNTCQLSCRPYDCPSRETDITRFESKQCMTPSCPVNGDFFPVTVEGSTQCFKVLRESATWEKAYEKCRELNLELAHPIDSVQLRKYIVLKYGPEFYVWLGACQDVRNKMTWKDTGEEITIDDPLWYTGQPDHHEGCLLLLSSKEYLEDEPEKTFWNVISTYEFYPLCEWTSIFA